MTPVTEAVAREAAADAKYAVDNALATLSSDLSRLLGVEVEVRFISKEGRGVKGIVISVVEDTESPRDR